MKSFRLIIVVLCLILSACGGSRVPAPKTAQAVSRNYFKRYGSKFPTTPFAKRNIESVTINQVQEISYRFALVDTIVTFVDGHAARTLLRMEKKFPSGWRVESWEVLQTK